ncbi:MAG TPA: glycosyltransferase [Gammaproteobacteria bacterium]|nr:glycosyltransferase [Gammaproteobacteria bacterium]
MLTSTFPRHARDTAGSFLADLTDTIPLEFVVVCPDDPSHEQNTKVERRTFGHANVFYGSGAVANLRSYRMRSMAALAALCAALSMLRTSLKATRDSAMIWSHWALPGGLVGALCRLVWRRPHVLLLHSGDVWLLERAPFGRLLTRFISSQTDEIYAVSAELAERFAALSGRRADVLGCGVRPNERRRVPCAPTRVGTLARLVPSKGALALAKRQAELDAELHIAGAGPEGPALQALAGRALCVHGELAGEAKLEYLRGLDVFLAPYMRSEWGQVEGLPVAVLEAMATGCPIVAFAGAVPAGLIENGTCGWLVADGDFGALIAKVNELIADPAARARMAERARARVEPYLLPRVASQWTQILKTRAR